MGGPRPCRPILDAVADLNGNQDICRWSRCHLPESKVKAAPVLLLHVALEAMTTAEYWCPQSSFTEHVVVLEEQETTWPWVPVTVAM